VVISMVPVTAIPYAAASAVELPNVMVTVATSTNCSQLTPGR